MALSEEFVGRTYPAVGSYQVGREKVREFATATGETSPLCHDLDAARAAGHPDLVAPVTFGIVVTTPSAARVIEDPDLGLDWSRVVHGEQRFEYSRPVHAGDELAATVTVESISAMAGNDLITSRTDVTDAAGAPVFSAWSTLVARGTA
ncbi:FAS1-like dehydratase domain-containing protein [Jatrophihabitans sp. YIM 134969]